MLQTEGLVLGWFLVLSEMGRVHFKRDPWLLTPPPPRSPPDSRCALGCPLLASVYPSMRFGHWVCLGDPGGLTVHGQVDGLAAADTDWVPDLALVGSSLLPADAMPGQYPAVGGLAEADGDGQGFAVEEPADLGGAGAAAHQV